MPPPHPPPPITKPMTRSYDPRRRPTQPRFAAGTLCPPPTAVSSCPGWSPAVHRCFPRTLRSSRAACHRAPRAEGCCCWTWTTGGWRPAASEVSAPSTCCSCGRTARCASGTSDTASGPVQKTRGETSMSGVKKELGNI